MAERDLQIFLRKIEQLNQLVHLINVEPTKRAELVQCSSHNQVIQLAEKWGFSISKRWGDTKLYRYSTTNNLLNHLCPPYGEKHNEILLKKTHFRVECIYLNSYVTPSDLWHSHHESIWLVVIQGDLVIQLKGQDTVYSLTRGDSLLIIQDHDYRVIQTDLEPGTIYLSLVWDSHDL